MLVRNLNVRVFYRVVATAAGLRMRAGWFERLLDWQTVESIEVSGDRVTVRSAGEAEVITDIAPGQVAQVAAVFEALRMRARNGLPDAAHPTPANADPRDRNPLPSDRRGHLSDRLGPVLGRCAPAVAVGGPMLRCGGEVDVQGQTEVLTVRGAQA